MLFIPFFADQQRNAFQSEQSGNGLTLPFTKLTTETLSATVNEMLTNQKYLNRAKELANLFNDNLVHPMNESIFWIEYVMRTKGAKHLKSHAVNMSWFSILLLDIFILPVISVAFIYVVIKSFVNCTKSKFNAKRNGATFGYRKAKRA